MKKLNPNDFLKPLIRVMSVPNLIGSYPLTPLIFDGEYSNDWNYLACLYQHPYFKILRKLFYYDI